LCGVVARLNFGGKDKTGDGSPEGLPLNCRFFLVDEFDKINSILRWRTLILVILLLKDHALAFPE
jgi:hypothetical protein